MMFDAWISGGVLKRYTAAGDGPVPPGAVRLTAEQLAAVPRPAPPVYPEPEKAPAATIQGEGGTVWKIDATGKLVRA